MNERPPIDPARIRRRMRELERLPDPRPGADGPGLIAAISRILGLTEPGEPIDAGLLAAVNRESRRTLTLYDTHYADWADPTPATYISLGFLQGITFATAIRDILDAAREAHETAPGPTDP